MKNPRILLLFTATLFLLCLDVSALQHPHIVFIVADDLGWNDVGFHNPEIISPNIDELALNGTILNHSYVQPVCSPSRGAFMTGYYPFRLGLQHLIIWSEQAVCAPLDKVFLPQVLKKYGYSTHALGKWHLGFCKWECTPTYRGFDTFYGYYSESEDYTTKTYVNGFDFRQNENVYREAANNYSTYQYADQAYDLILSHDQSQPLFLYFALQSVHEPLEVPDYYFNLYPNITNKDRRTYSGMVTAMDDAVGKLTTALKKSGMFNNTIIFFTADNGGWVTKGGNNYPLRGGKITIWEGGTRVPAFVHSPKYVQRGAVYDGIMHAIDWFPTIVEAGNMTHEDPNRDGVSQWKAITSLSSSPRTEFVYNLDNHTHPDEGESAIRVGDYKLIEGYPGAYNTWYPPDTKWNYRLTETNWTDFKGLFNLIDDPYEKVNLYSKRPDIVSKLKARLDYYKSLMVPPNYPDFDPSSDPSHYNGTWSPGWC